MQPEAPTRERNKGSQSKYPVGWRWGRTDKGQSWAWAQGLTGELLTKGIFEGCNYLPPVRPQTKEPPQPKNSNYQAWVQKEDWQR